VPTTAGRQNVQFILRPFHFVNGKCHVDMAKWRLQKYAAELNLKLVAVK